MRMSSFLSTVAFSAAVAVASVAGPSIAMADSGTVRVTIVKGGFFVGASGGDGVLRFRGRTYPLSIGGLSAGLVFGASQARLVGRVTNIRRPSDVAGVYGAVGAGGAIGPGAGAIMLQNNKGAVLRLEGRQVGLMANVDLSGLSISLR